ncbi:MAG: 4Fe-4S binding protein, partial [Spirochaetaceae bacterium]|nr:4Fe-4S binding protein [Spirochaetaceae bacterium]
MMPKIHAAFAIPPLAALDACLDVIIQPHEQRIIQEIAAADGSDGASMDVAALYRRGILDIAGEPESAYTAPRYKLADFYTRLEVFVITEHDAWRRLPRAVRQEIDAWYFDAYYSRLAISAETPPTEDAVFTLDETLAFIDRETRQPYLAPCDCRSLANELYGPSCGKPLEVCISFKNGPNTGAHRGITKPITKDTAKEVVMQADRAGLIHRVNPGTICNCCIDCCYLSRAQRRRNEAIDFYNDPRAAAWPVQTQQVRLDPSSCVQCGQCIERCPLKLFSIEDGVPHNDTSRCIGCGLCVTTCPSGALVLEAAGALRGASGRLLSPFSIEGGRHARFRRERRP